MTAPTETKFQNRSTSDLTRLIEQDVSRRSVLERGVGIGAFALVASTLATKLAGAGPADRFGFAPVMANRFDTITVPVGYNWHIVARWGDPLWSDAASFDPVSRGTGASQERALGDNVDGMLLFRSERKNILVVNNEFVNRANIYANRWSKRPENADDVRKGKAAHGISIFEIETKFGRWAITQNSPYNRRITADTPMDIRGPARGHLLLKTDADPDGVMALGTFNNCGCGLTPWGTYLTCEENFNAYFSSSDPETIIPSELARYGIKHKDWGYRWASADDRFDIAKTLNEPNRFGYVVEIDPLDPASTPQKRTALGRIKHENAEVVLSANRHVVVYMGDDERGEFLYKFVSEQPYLEDSETNTLLDRGTLYAAKFNEDGRGEWLPLTPETTGLSSIADICIHTRLAASAVQATTMDRPEWIAAHPSGAEVYVCLTNNKNRGRKPNRGGDATPVGGPNPRTRNIYGQIVRWQPDAGDHASTAFSWNFFALAGNPQVHDDAHAGSKNITPENMFNSPDGLSFDTQGRLWIRTDGKDTDTGDYEGQGNNQMLVGDPMSGEIRRFMVGPRECEVTGLTWSADKKTLFVGIQHPGAKGGSHFPDGGDAPPRSSIIAIARDDGEVIG